MRDTDWEMADEQAHGNEPTVEVEAVEDAPDKQPGTALAKPPALVDVNPNAAEVMRLAEQVEAMKYRFAQFSAPYYAMQHAASHIRGCIGDVLAGVGMKDAAEGV